MMKFNAIYENGVLRPSEPLPFQEGEAVEVTVAAKPVEPRSERELADRIRSASNLNEWIEATKLLPDDDGGYDILQALDANRRHAFAPVWSGPAPAVSLACASGYRPHSPRDR